MTKTQIVERFTGITRVAGLKIKKYSPEILLGVGIVGGVASAVMACKATLKVNEVLDEAKGNLERIHEATKKGVTQAGEYYTEEDAKKDTTLAYIQSAVKFGKLYAPAVMLGTASVCCVLASNNIMRKRNLALAAAYMAEHTALKDYRQRVLERFGKDVERELRYNIKAQEVEETVVDEKGNESVVKKVVDVVDPNTISEFARVYDCGNIGWTKDAEANKYFLLQTQNHFNDLLRIKKIIFLNDVYDALGFPRTKLGQSWGWAYRPNDPNYMGDNFIDFGIFDIHDPNKVAFVNGLERSILLDFNVDGPVDHLL